MSQNVYIVTSGMRYEGSDVDSVWSTEEAAERRVESLKTEDPKGYFIFGVSCREVQP